MCGAEPLERGRFEFDDRLRVRLAYRRGNAAALHRELEEQARAASGPVPPTVKTLQRVILRVLMRSMCWMRSPSSVKLDWLS
ncbi:hypothetical protein AOZ06_28640 [Kibdelosporangium phytohabitans]|uniref:Uncharacterized protein n=1 Tax=Kibdelosporangium phytohabitans TaxID=860235 RepID=A0A0N9I376_9PSEU|nr:hypothetical protein AOZ06_28640 [Kibdelosporangium phytohabitans]